ncbi:hypothetical protein [Acinetobacter sp. ANC 4648]|uniref:hypothetical protein n=1 Tax=Acinetobacter sp. ANC 4648 TaxID=1977875 RepID=UPI000A3410DC|nr:hypothetical protein [Acinetobacter sp. ANC 4648]OTG79368.1 hypothetical protein B9T27_14585 [Acinetobacter sp. ANC 4648]
MVVCSFDWELASKFIPLITGLVPIGITWFLYRQWHTQKQKEVIANECKDLWYKLDDLEKSYKKLSEITSYTISVSDQQEIEKKFFSDVKEWIYENLSKMSLIKKLTNNDKNVIESIDLLDNDLSSFNTYLMLKRFSNRSEIPKLVKKNDVLANINKVKDSLIPFINFSKRK